MTNQTADHDLQPTCSLPGCEDETSVRDAGSGAGYCSKDHLFEDVNGEKNVDDGETTVALESLNCNYCGHESDRASYENGKWVHYPCGMEITDEQAEEADKRLAAGEGVHDITEKQAKLMAGSFVSDLKRADKVNKDNE